MPFRWCNAQKHMYDVHVLVSYVSSRTNQTGSQPKTNNKNMSNAMWTERCGDKCAEEDADDVVKSATTPYDNNKWFDRPSGDKSRTQWSFAFPTKQKEEEEKKYHFLNRVRVLKQRDSDARKPEGEREQFANSNTRAHVCCAVLCAVRCAVCVHCSAQHISLYLFLFRAAFIFAFEIYIYFYECSLSLERETIHTVYAVRYVREYTAHGKHTRTFRTIECIECCRWRPACACMCVCALLKYACEQHERARIREYVHTIGQCVCVQRTKNETR